MGISCPIIRLADAIRYRKEFITIDDSTTYIRVTAKLQAKGIVLRDEIEGSRLKTKKQQICKTGDFLVAEIDAKVGGFGIVPDDLEGAIVSSHYFLFEIDQNRLDKEYLAFFIRIRNFQKQIRARGSTNYAAVRPEAVLALEIPLPSLQEQKRLVSRIESLLTRAESARQLSRHAGEEERGLTASEKAKIFSKVQAGSCRIMNLDEAAPVNMGQSPPGHSYNELREGVPLLNGPTEFGRRYPTAVQWTTAPTKLCKKGDVLICVRGATTGRMNWADREYCIGRGLAALTPRKEICNSEYVYFFIETQTQQMLALTAGSTFPNLPGAKLRKLNIPIPSLDEQHNIVEYLSSLEKQMHELEKLQRETEKEIEALIPSILDKAFKGSL